MKKISFFIVILLNSVLIFSQNQQIDNSSFENWTNSQPIEPAPWKCNIAFQFMGQTIYITTGTQTSDAYEGSYAAKLETKTYQSMVVPGVLQLSRLKVNSNFQYQFVGLYPFSSRPLGISFWAKYLPQTNDSAFVGVFLTKFNSSINKRDTIGASFFFLPKAVNNYTQFFLPIFYRTTDFPDSIDIGFTSSSLFNAKVGSILYVDKVEMLYDTAPFPTLALPAVNIKYNYFDARWLASPYSNKYRLDVATDENFTNFVEGYQDFLIEFNQPDSIVIYRVNFTQNYANQTLYYRVRVDYGTYQSNSSNVIPVLIPQPPANLTTDFLSFQFVADDKRIYVYNATFNDVLTIYNALGQIVKVVKIDKNPQVIELSKSGLYLIKIVSQQREYSTKLIVR